MLMTSFDEIEHLLQRSNYSELHTRTHSAIMRAQSPLKLLYAKLSSFNLLLLNTGPRLGMLLVFVTCLPWYCVFILTEVRSVLLR